MKRSSTAAERRYMARAKELGCMLCRHLGYGETEAQIHHARLFVGWGRDGHFNVIPLCFEHHEGDTGLHLLGREQFAARYGISELELLARTQKELAACAA
jgi:hypothetical protein